VIYLVKGQDVRHRHDALEREETKKGSER